MMIKHDYPYLVTAKDDGYFWFFNGVTHKKKILDLRNIDNLKELQFYSGDCVIVRNRGRSTVLCHASSVTNNENKLEEICSEIFTKNAWVIYNDEFERLVEYFKKNCLKTGIKFF
ncbi:hypothetical protein ACN9TD_14125 [Lactococcus lactis]